MSLSHATPSVIATDQNSLPDLPTPTVYNSNGITGADWDSTGNSVNVNRDGISLSSTTPSAMIPEQQNKSAAITTVAQCNGIIGGGNSTTSSANGDAGGAQVAENLTSLPCAANNEDVKRVQEDRAFDKTLPISSQNSDAPIESLDNASSVDNAYGKESTKSSGNNDGTVRWYLNYVKIFYAVFSLRLNKK